MRVAIDDKDKLEQFLDYLPPDRIRELDYKLSDAFYTDEDFYLITDYESFCKLPYAHFNNSKIEKARVDFNGELIRLLNFLITHCFPVSNSRYKLYPEMRHSEEPERSAFWIAKFEELKTLASNFNDKYENFLQMSRDEIASMKNNEPVLISKEELSNYHISFDNETARLKLGEFKSVDFPPHSKQHSVLKKLFSNRMNEAIEWENINEEITGHVSDRFDRNESEKQKKALKDAVRAINKRVMEVCNTDSLLLKWETNSVKRLY